MHDLSQLIDTFFATRLPTGSMSYLNYSDRLNQLPLSVIGTALGTAILPQISRFISKGEPAEAAKVQSQAVELSMLLCLPAFLALAVVAQPLVAALFQGGKFTATDALITGNTLAIIVAGCAATTLGAALALWASVEAFGGNTSFVTVTVVTMVGGTLASAAPTPGGVGAVEAALIGGLAAFGVPAAVAVPSVLLYRVLTCWLPVFIGWPVMRLLTRNDMI